MLSSTIHTAMGFLLALWLAVTSLQLAKTQEDKSWVEEEDILVLNQHNFARALQTYKLLLVEFYVPWSGHCQALAQEFARAAVLLKKEAGPLARLGKVDCTQEEALRAEFGITGYPVLKLFKDGNRTHPMDFPDEQEAAGIVEWLKRKAGPSLVLLEEVDAVASFVNLHNVAVVGFFQDLQDPDVGLFADVASDTPEVAFAITDNLLLFEQYNITEDTISLFRKDDGQRVDFFADTELGLDAKDLAQFISVQSLDLVMELTNKNSSKIFGAKIPNHLLLFINKSVDSQLRLLGPFREGATAFRGQVLFVLVDVNGEGAGVLQHFGLKVYDAPALRFINIEANKKYRLTTEGLTAHGLHTFCQEVLQGKIQPHLMSEEIPSDWDKKWVKVVVGKNFEQVAFDETKNVFVKFYASWCPHSKALAPAWEKLGEKYKDHKNIVIAEMDATANEVEDLTIHGYPTLYFFPAGPGRQMIEYTGSRDTESFSRFLEGGGKPLSNKETGAAETLKEPQQDGMNPPETTESREEL
ncbi:protein disulfide-isomerase A2 isoform X2 [Crotalus tigris]|uniref:protein disulfide-isomerase A2 isoform X2 n=1 Tax=Crotalus tigris TaxID=88082 RepID=UPI00192F603C|nr:protein disulfide-isomerase A2 isoform X2 [Crotalus tigris]